MHPGTRQEFLSSSLEAVAQALGDGIFAWFGALIAHEDHAQWALCMQDEMRC